MRSILARTAILCVCALAVSSCGSNTDLRSTTPPAEDLKVLAEPVYPIEALSAADTGPLGLCEGNTEYPDPDQCGEHYQDLWWKDALAWGRQGWGQNARVCQWSRDMGKELPRGWCGD